MSTNNYRRNLLATTIFGAVVAIAAPVSAQAQNAEQSTSVSDIVVTGSRIARQDYKSTSPIVTVDAEDFQATGSVTIDNLMNDMPQFVPAANQTSNNPSAGGQAQLNLRGLGASRTLVLMNGRRVVPSGSSGVVDTNVVPTALIKNIEVISGGASAAYGSDALAGVANFILDQNFSGVQFDAQYGETDKSDGTSQSYSLTVGGNFADDRGNAVLSIGRSTRGPIYNAARKFSAISGGSGASPLGSTTFDANNRPDTAVINDLLNSSGVLPTGAFGYNPDGSLFAYTGTVNFQSPGGIDYDGFVTPGGNWVYNTGPLNLLNLPLERNQAYASGRYRVNDAVELYAEAHFTQYESGNTLAPTPASGAVPATGFRVPVTNPFISADLASALASRLYTDGRPAVDGTFPTTPGRSQQLWQVIRPAGMTDDEFAAYRKVAANWTVDPAAGDPALRSFALDKRFNEVGGRTATENYDVYQLTLGARGNLAVKDWSYDAYLSYGRMDNTTTQTGNVSRSSVQRLLDAADGGASLCAGGFNPFGLSQTSAECIRYIARTSINTTVSDMTNIELTLQGGAFELPAGEARFAVGALYRENSYLFTPDASLSQTNAVVNRPDGGQTGGSEIAGFNPSSRLEGHTSSTEFFTEWLIPLVSDVQFVQQLDLNVGYRYSDYSSAGGVHSYKAELDWAVIDGLRFRGGYQRSVRAPTIGELYAPRGTSFPNIGSATTAGQGDPCDFRSSYRTGPDAAKVLALCTTQAPAAGASDFLFSNNQVPAIVGGNPELTEETSDSYTIGAVYQPQFSHPMLSRISASIDYYSIKIDDVIASIGASSALQGCFNLRGENPTYDNNNAFCQLFSRDPLSGNVNNQLGLNRNQATLKTSGIDAQFDWTFDMEDAGLPAWGTLSANVVVGWLEARDNQVIAGGPTISRKGTIDSGFSSTYPEWKTMSGINWRNGAFAAGLRWRRVGEVTQYASTNEFGAKDYFDLNGSWNVNDTVSLRAGVNNLSDTQPVIFVPGVQANTDPSTYDTLGRRWHVAMTARF